MKIDTVEELLLEELKDLYDAEKQLVRALPKFAKAASDDELREAFQQHLEQTKGQVQRLEQVFEQLGEKPKSKPCKGMKGLVEEGMEVMSEDASEMLSDEAIICAAQKVEHYEMAAYGSARTLTQAMGNKDAASLLQETLDEEGETDKRLTQIAKRLIKESGGREASGNKETRGESRGSSGERKSAPSSKRNGGSSARSNGGSNGGRNGGTSRGKAGSSHGSQTTTDHEEIRRWAEERGAQPACVKGTGGKKDIGLLRLDFPGYSGGKSLQHIGWDDFFKKFDERNLALIYQDTTAEGKKSNFNKLINRE